MYDIYRSVFNTNKNLSFVHPLLRSSLKPDSETTDYDVPFLFSLFAPLIVLIAFAFIIKGLFQTIALKALKENQKVFELVEQSFKQLRISSNEDLDSKKSAIEKQLVQLNQELNGLKKVQPSWRPTSTSPRNPQHLDLHHHRLTFGTCGQSKAWAMGRTASGGFIAPFWFSRRCQLR